MGINCFFDPDVCLKTMKAVKEGLDKAGLKRHLMVQPIGYRTPECMDHNNPASKTGFTGLAEFSLGMKFRTSLCCGRPNGKGNWEKRRGTWEGRECQL